VYSEQWIAEQRELAQGKLGIMGLGTQKMVIEK